MYKNNFIIKIILFIQILLLVGCNSGSKLNDNTYQIVVDAGSSGSRVYLYKIIELNNSVNIQLVQNINNKNEAIDNLKIYGGISNYATQLNQLDTTFIEPLRKYVNSFCTNHIIENNNCYNIPVHILSTGGMRLLPESQNIAINTYILSKLKNVGFNNKQNEATTIPGWQEGLYSWLDINYLNNVFDSNQNTQNLIEVGGASAQIAFEFESNISNLIENNNPNISQNIVNFMLGKKLYHIYSVSFLGLGQDQALLKMKSDTMHNFCLNKSNNDLDSNFEYSTCSKIYEGIISSYNISQTLTGIKPINNSYYAIGSFYYNNMFWSESAKFSPEIIIVPGIHRFIENQCNEKTLNEIKDSQKDKSNNKPELECPNITYTDLFLNNIQLLQANNTMIKSLLTLNNHEISWTLGFIFAKYSSQKYT
jgi:hypothetical protein